MSDPEAAGQPAATADPPSAPATNPAQNAPGYDRHISVDLANRIVALLNSHPADVPNLAPALRLPP